MNIIKATSEACSVPKPCVFLSYSIMRLCSLMLISVVFHILSGVPPYLSSYIFVKSKFMIDNGKGNKHFYFVYLLQFQN